ncbi:MAG: hypothetical protein KJ721_00830 [Nanoarchaeota archaeon]|nr:hypothetical protein [Nanoarchaeota archaeon]
MVKINKKKIELTLLLITLVQVFLLINLVTADSYIIRQKDSTPLGVSQGGTRPQSTEFGGNELIKSGISLLSGFLSIKQIGLVSADEGDYCCPKTENGAFCVDTSSNYWDCAESLLSGSCESNNCLSCCPETTNGQICKNTPTKYPEQCKMDLVSGSCESNNCLSCCTEIISDNKSKENFCIDTSRYHSICADPLVSGSCASNNCRIIGLNEPTIGWESSSITLAGDLSWNCCPVTKTGAICQGIASTDTESCAVGIIPTKCDTFSDCKIGCCIDEEQGLCSTKSTKQKCEMDGGKWDEEESCLINECQKGCCVLGSDVQFVTEQRCGYLSPLYGFEKDFRDLTTEIACLSLAASQLKGACILEGNDCKFVTEQECLKMAGAFSQGNLCSNPALNTSCERQASVGCSDGNDEIFWFDSCGNKENIYSSDKDLSWNEGVLLSKENSCNAGYSNADSTDCGNCNYFMGSKCSESSLTDAKVADGDFVCESMNCIDENGDERSNGESWCVYDSYIGEGKDTAGSRHWKRMCIDGEIKVEGCADYRGGVCVQAEMEGEGETFTTASCVVNEAMRCIGYNSDKNMEEKCTANKDCMIKSINVAEHFKFDVCVGDYPRGFGLDESSDRGSSQQICGMASQTCSVMWEKDWKGRWRCIDNCACESAVFTTQMNDLCVSLGDCGSYVNYIGEGTDNIQVSGAPGISWKDYKNFAEPVKGQFAEPKDIREFLGAMGGTDVILSPDEESKLAKMVDMLGTVSGGLGSAILGTYTTEIGASIIYNIPSVSVNTASVGAFANAAIGAAVGAYVGSYIAQSLGRTGDAAMVMTVAGAVAGAVAGYAYAQGISLVALGPLMAVFWVAIIIMVFIAIIGWGETQIRRVEFTCMPWQAPLGGSDCKKCDDDPMKPCSEYKCDSLGQACELLNANTENPICESLPNDGRPPIISTKEISEDYSFTEIANKRVKLSSMDRDDECITEFTQVSFSLETDEYAQCKFDFERTGKYEDMAKYPIEQTIFSREHNFVFSMPSVGSLEVYNVTGDLKEMFGNMNMYVRCQDYHGNVNVDEYAVNFCINSGPDRTAVKHAFTKTEPKSGSFVAYNQTEQDLTIWINEPAECKYDVVGNKSYDQMLNSMECKTDITEIGKYGWACNTTLTGLEAGQNDFYIKCKDKPWVITQEDIDKYEARNVNAEAFVYTIHGSKSMLKIDSVSPKGEIDFGFEPISLDLEAKTSGGMDNGESTCYYSFTDYDRENQFFETFSRYHKQNFNLMRGDYTFAIRCEDDAGNLAYENASFTLNIDSSPPEVVRVYKSGNYMRLITDEDAECYYSFNNCYFDIDTSVSTTSGFSTIHSAEWILGKTYHIRCKDVWGNANTDCAIKVSPSFFE